MKINLEKYKKFTLDELAKKCSYDVNLDHLDIREDLELNIYHYECEVKKGLDEIAKILKDENNEFIKYNIEFINENKTKNKILSLLNKIKKFNVDFDISFYNEEIIKLKDEDTFKLRMLSKNILREWKEIFYFKLAKLSSNHIDICKENVIRIVRDWVRLINKFDSILVELGNMGDELRTFVMSTLKNGLRNQKNPDDIDEKELMNSKKINTGGTENFHSESKMVDFKHYYEILNKDSIQRLCEVLGKLLKAKKIKQKENYICLESYNELIPTQIKNEISGIITDKELQNAVPQELALLNDPDLNILFDMKFLDNKLFCFEKQGFEIIKKTREIIKQRDIEKDELKGPIILCVDTSGSMNGNPEIIAKAISLFICEIAIKEKRDCYLIHFSSKIKTLKINKNTDLEKLIDFLKLSFNSGTDVILAFKEVVNMMNVKNYEKADTLLISDFIFDSKDHKRLKEMIEKSNSTNKFYGLYIGGHNLIPKSTFDAELMYNYKNNSVEFINNIPLVN